jgi:hypothetical protein
MPRGKCKFTEAAVTRILKAATKANVIVWLEIKPDGTVIVRTDKSSLQAPASDGTVIETADELRKLI